MSEENGGADLSLKVAGQEINVRNVKSLNTMATVATLILVILIGYVILEHKIDAKADGVDHRQVQREQIAAIRDMASAVKLQTCLASLPESQKQQAYASPHSICNIVSRER